MASYRSSVMKRLVCVSILMAMLALVDVTAANDQQLSADLVAGLTQQAYLRGNTKGAMVTEEMHVGDASFLPLFATDYSDGRSPTANCKRNCPRRP